jgi:hypothetical protein
MQTPAAGLDFALSVLIRRAHHGNVCVVLVQGLRQASTRSSGSSGIVAGHGHQIRRFAALQRSEPGQWPGVVSQPSDWHEATRSGEVAVGVDQK